MKLFRNALAAAIALACLMAGAPALATNMTVKDASNTTHIICSTVQAGVDMPCYLVYGKRPDGTYGPILTDSNGYAVNGAFKLQGAASLAVSTSSARVALPAGPTALLINNGAVDLYFSLGSSSVTAASTNYLLPAGGRLPVATDSNAYIAAITGSGSTTLAILTGTGNPTHSGGGSGSGGGSSDASAAKQDIGNASLSSIDTKLTSQATAAKQDTAKTALDLLHTDNVSALATTDGIESLIGTTNTNTSTANTNLGAPGATACATDNGSCSINALIQRTNQRLTSLIGSTLAVTVSGVSTAANQTTELGYLDGVEGLIGTTNTGIGAPGDTAWTSGSGSMVALLKAIAAQAISTTPADTYSQPNAGANYGLVSVVSSAVETGHVIKASAGTLYGLSVTTGATAGNILVFNATTVPAAGTVAPIKCYPIAANSVVAVGYNPPLYMSTGISLAFSSASSCFTKTDSSTAFISGDAK